MPSISAKATQDFVPIKEVRDGIAILKDGSLRAILLASSLNFSLKSEEEREAILFQFQNFLNSLDFSIQIFVQSRKLDIRPYIALLEQQEKEQVNDLLKIQVQEYIEFVKSFTEKSNIMTKGFFVVVPYASGALKTPQKSSFGFGNKSSTEAKQRENETFEENRTQLDQRLAVVSQGLIRCGVKVAQLGTEEIIELFYKIFNPGETEKPIQLDK